MLYIEPDLRPGKITNLLLTTPDIDFILKDYLFEEGGVTTYKITAHCVRVSDIPNHGGLLDFWFCWGFQFSNSSGLRIRSWNFSDEDIAMADGYTGKGIGTIIMNLIMKAVHELNVSQNASVKPMELAATDALDEANKLRRNAFYKNFGFQLHFKDDQEKVGWAVASDVGSLKQFVTGKPHKFMQLSKYMMDAERRMNNLQLESQRLKEELSSVRERYYLIKERVSYLNPLKVIQAGFMCFMGYIIIPVLEAFDKMVATMVGFFRTKR